MLSTDDYPGSMMADLVARELALPGGCPRVNLLLQHKYHARVAQARMSPELVPAFAWADSAGQVPLRLPYFVKPVKSFFSIGGQRVSGQAELPTAIHRATLPECFLAPFRELFEDHVHDVQFGRGRVIAEELLQGRQATLEGFAFDGEIHIIGIVDSVMFPGTPVFRRFEYPSTLPAGARERIAQRPRP